MGRSFRTQAKERKQLPAAPFIYELDDAKLPVNVPDATQITLFSAMFGASDVEDADRIHGVLSFARTLFGPAGYKHIRGRLDDADDEFDIFDLMTVLQDVVQEIVEGFPTEPSSSSPASRTTTGARSTARAPGKGSTQKTSRPRASTT